MPVVHRPAVGILTLALFLTASPSVQAQRKPSEFMRTLARASLFARGDSVEMAEGKLPEALAGKLPLPEGARVIGTVWGDSVAQVWATMVADGDSIRASFARAAAARGWTKRVVEPGYGPLLQPDAPAGRPTVYCRDNAQVTLSTLPPVNGSMQISVRYQAGLQYSACTATPPRPRREDPFAGITPLRAPPVAPGRTTQSCYPSGGSGRAGTSAYLPTTLSGAELLRFYGAQLDSAGWKGSPPARTTAGSVWTRVEPSGDTTTLTLTFSPTRPADPSCWEVMLSVSHH